jgi:hypothetical protein
MTIFKPDGVTAKVECDLGCRGSERDAEDRHRAALDQAGTRVNGRSLRERRHDRFGPSHHGFRRFALALK